MIAPVRSTFVPADVRLANLVRIVQELRGAGSLSRSDVARQVGMSLPTAHRLVADLVDLGLVVQESPAPGYTRLGRPPVVYRFREDVGLLAGIDVGNETTRLAITTLSGRALASRSLPSSKLGRRRLPEMLAGIVAEMIASADPTLGGLAGVGIGIAARVDAAGVLRNPPSHQAWDGLPLREPLSAELGCEVAVAQDDHLSPIAESSDRGTFPGASSLLVLEIGKGIGVGMTLDGVAVAGASGGFGRIAGLAADRARQRPGQDPGRVPGYRRPGRPVPDQGRHRPGSRRRHAGRRGPRAATGRPRWSWAGPPSRSPTSLPGLQHLCDPEAIVIGGGLARAHDLLDPVLGRAGSRRACARPAACSASRQWSPGR